MATSVRDSRGQPSAAALADRPEMTPDLRDGRRTAHTRLRQEANDHRRDGLGLGERVQRARADVHLETHVREVRCRLAGRWSTSWALPPRPRCGRPTVLGAAR